MFPRLSTFGGPALDAELKRQSAYISLGLLALLFPFLPKWVIVLGVLFGTIAIVLLSWISSAANGLVIVSRTASGAVASILLTSTSR